MVQKKVLYNYVFKLKYWNITINQGIKKRRKETRGIHSKNSTSIISSLVFQNVRNKNENGNEKTDRRKPHVQKQKNLFSFLSFCLSHFFCMFLSAAPHRFYNFSCFCIISSNFFTSQRSCKTNSVVKSGGEEK